MASELAEEFGVSVNDVLNFNNIKDGELADRIATKGLNMLREAAEGVLEWMYNNGYDNSSVLERPDSGRPLCSIILAHGDALGIDSVPLDVKVNLFSEVRDMLLFAYWVGYRAAMTDFAVCPTCVPYPQCSAQLHHHKP